MASHGLVRARLRSQLLPRPRSCCEQHGGSCAEDGEHLWFVAQRPIPSGSHITTSYLNFEALLKPKELRQKARSMLKGMLRAGAPRDLGLQLRLPAVSSGGREGLPERAAAAPVELPFPATGPGPRLGSGARRLCQGPAAAAGGVAGAAKRGAGAAALGDHLRAPRGRRADLLGPKRREFNRVQVCYCQLVTASELVKEDATERRRWRPPNVTWHCASGSSGRAPW